MTGEQVIIHKQFSNGDVAVDEGNGLVYRTPDAAYTIELDPPGHPLSGEPYGVNLVRTTLSPHGLEREQRLTLAEYPSFMSAEEHQREAEKTLLERGREGLQPAMTLVDTMPYEPDSAVYLVGVYPLEPETDRGTLSLIRLDGEHLNVAPVSHGSIAELVPIEQRLWDVKASGDTGKLLDAAALEATRSGELAPGTSLFAWEGAEMIGEKSISFDSESLPPEWEAHPDWPDAKVWDEPPTPLPGALVLPVTFGDSMTPYDDQGRYVPHHQDETGMVHFFSVIDRPSDSPLPEGVDHELRYFRAQQTGDNIIVHDSQPVMGVTDSTMSPWPLPALHLYLEEGDLDAAQQLAHDTAQDNALQFPDKLPALGTEVPQREPNEDWYHFDTALVATTPQGVDDGYSVGVVDVYANHQTGGFAARCLPMGEYKTFDEALERQHALLHRRLVEGHESALTTNGFNESPALYERFAQQEADNGLTDLLEKYDGHYPPDYDGDLEPEWEPLTSKEWGAYRDHVQVVSEIVPGTDYILKGLPSATPDFATDTLVAASEQPEAPYQPADDLQPQEVSPSWHLDIVPARDTNGHPLGYSAVCVVEYGDLAEVVAPDSTDCGMWLEVAQFQTEDRAKQFKDDFMSLVESDELDHVTGPALAGFIADDIGTDSQWQTMNQPMLDKLKAEEWSLTHQPDHWQPRMDETAPVQTVSADIDL
jgi:hypothetical protein